MLKIAVFAPIAMASVRRAVAARGSIFDKKPDRETDVGKHTDRDGSGEPGFPPPLFELRRGRLRV